MDGVPIVQLLSSLEPALSSLERQVGMWRDLSLAPGGGESRHFFLAACWAEHVRGQASSEKGEDPERVPLGFVAKNK